MDGVLHALHERERPRLARMPRPLQVLGRRLLPVERREIGAVGDVVVVAGAPGAQRALAFALGDEPREVGVVEPAGAELGDLGLGGVGVPAVPVVSMVLVGSVIVAPPLGGHEGEGSLVVQFAPQTREGALPRGSDASDGDVQRRRDLLVGRARVGHQQAQQRRSEGRRREKLRHSAASRSLMSSASAGGMSRDSCSGASAP